MQVQAVFEVDGSDVSTVTVSYETHRTTSHAIFLYKTARSLANEHNVPLSDVSIRFVEVTE